MSVAVIVFTVLATLQMAQWADKKHRTYKKEHGDKYPRNRKRMIPYVW
jgi:very-long-chain enoyl-CoA reductase